MVLHNGPLTVGQMRWVAVLAAPTGSALWGGLYVGLGVGASRLSGLLPTGNLTTLVTVGLGLTFGWVALFTTRRMATVSN